MIENNMNEKLITRVYMELAIKKNKFTKIPLRLRIILLGQIPCLCVQVTNNNLANYLEHGHSHGQNVHV